MKFLTGLLAFISSFFAGDSLPESQPLPPLNSSIIAFHETYFAPAVAEPGNFPFTKAIKFEKEPIKPTIAPSPPLPPAPAIVLPTAPAPIVPPPPLPPTPIDAGDPYVPQNIPFVDQSTQWLKMDFSLNGNIYDNAEHSLSNITMDREYWKVDVFTYWAPGILPPRPPLEIDYFKLEIYDEGTSKVIYTMTSGDEENIHKSQIFKKAGKYTFKAFAKTNGKYEINFLVSPKMAK
ncbi:MAG TPA: hypothetical protein VJC01_02525 [Candidatus Paceibacterota bacterium]